VQQALESRLTEGIEQLRAAEVARLDGPQATLREAAMTVDAAAVNACVKIVQARARLLGLFHAPSRRPDDSRISGAVRNSGPWGPVAGVLGP
jgi:hypothetical protein